MEKTETKVVVSQLPNIHYPSQEELRAHTQRLIDNPSWPFNPNFPKMFSFPAFGTAEWLALAWWISCKGDVTKIRDAEKIRAGAQLNWRFIWGKIYCRQYIPPSLSWIPDTTNYSMKHPEGWVQTLLDADRFWLVEINVWALQMVVKEFEETNGKPLAAWPFPPDAKQCENLCHHFHAWQQARYRWYEHLLEKHCDRALGRRDKKPQTALEARACLIGWLSRQRGYAKHPLVTQFTRRKPRPEQKQERYFFDKERCAPSNHRYQTRFVPSRPDEIGWLILTWPVWNFHRWRWTDIAEAVIKKFRFVDAKGKPLDFLKTSKKRLQKALRENSDASGSMPAEKALALFYEYLLNPTPKEKEMHEDWERTVRSRSRDKAIEKLARSVIGNRLEKQILRRLAARPKRTDKKPLLWDFAQQISA